MTNVLKNLNDCNIITKDDLDTLVRTCPLCAGTRTFLYDKKVIITRNLNADNQVFLLTMNSNGVEVTSTKESVKDYIASSKTVNITKDVRDAIVNNNGILTADWHLHRDIGMWEHIYGYNILYLVSKRILVQIQIIRDGVTYGDAFFWNYERSNPRLQLDASDVLAVDSFIIKNNTAINNRLAASGVTVELGSIATM